MVDTVSVSEVAMDAVSVSEVAMDAVSVSDVALDAIQASQVAYDAIKVEPMAIGKYSVGLAGLDGANYADIGAVASSQTAMDTVAASIDARSAVFESDYAIDSLWASSPGARTILETGTPSLPHTYDGGRLEVKVDDGSNTTLPGTTSNVLMLDTLSSDTGITTRDGLALELDLSNSTTMEFKSKADSVPASYINHGVMIDGSVVQSSGDNYGWTNRSVDISGYNGTHTVKFFQFNDGYNGGTFQGYFADLNLI